MCYVSSCGKGTDHYTQKGGKEGKKLALVDTVTWSTLLHRAVAYPGIFFRGVQQIQLRREDRENGDLGL